MLKQVKLELIMILKSPALWILAVFGNGLLNFAIFDSSLTTSWSAAHYISKDLIPVLGFVTVLFGASLPQKDRLSRVHELLSTLPHPAWMPFLGRLAAGVMAIAALGLQLFFLTALRQGALQGTGIDWVVYLNHLLVMALPTLMFALCLGYCLGSLLSNSWLAMPAGTTGWLGIIYLSTEIGVVRLPLLGILAPSPLLVLRNVSPALGWFIDGPLIIFNRLFLMAMAMFLALAVLHLLQRLQRRGSQRELVVSGVGLGLSLTLVLGSLGGYSGEMARRFKAYNSELESLPVYGSDLPRPDSGVLPLAYDLDITLNTWESGIHGQAVITVVPTIRSSEIVVTLDSCLEILEAEMAGARLNWSRQEHEITLHLPQALEAGDNANIIITWQGTINYWRHGWADRNLELVSFVNPNAVLLPQSIAWYPRVNLPLASYSVLSQYLAQGSYRIVDGADPGQAVPYTLRVTTNTPLGIGSNLPLTSATGQNQYNFGPSLAGALLLVGGPFSHYAGSVSDGFINDDFQWRYQQIDKNLSQAVDALEKLLPSVPGRLQVISLPQALGTVALPPLDNALLLRELDLRRGLRYQNRRGLSQHLLPLWWQERSSAIPTWLEVSLQDYLADFLVLSEDVGFYGLIREERLRIDLNSRESSGRDNPNGYVPDRDLVRNPDPYANRLWLALDRIRTEQGEDILRETVLYLFQQSLEDQTFTEEQTIVSWVIQQAGGIE